MKELITLDLSDNELVDDDIKILAEYVKTNKTIKTLKLYKNKLTSSGGFYIADALIKNKSIECLDISNNEVNKSGLTSLLNVLGSNNKTLLDLNIGYNQLIEEDFFSISNYLKENPSIDTLDISGNIISPKSANVLGISLKKANNLRYIKVNRTGLNDENAPQLFNYIKNTNITDIELDLNKFGDMSASIMNRFKSSQKLRRISFRQCEMSSLFLSILGNSLKSGTSIEIVSLEWNNYDEENFINFCNEIKSNKNIIIKFTQKLLPACASKIAEDVDNIVLI